jgi:hypothetical protein
MLSSVISGRCLNHLDFSYIAFFVKYFMLLVLFMYLCHGKR